MCPCIKRFGVTDALVCGCTSETTTGYDSKFTLPVAWPLVNNHLHVGLTCRVVAYGRFGCVKLFKVEQEYRNGSIKGEKNFYISVVYSTHKKVLFFIQKQKAWSLWLPWQSWRKIDQKWILSYIDIITGCILHYFMSCTLLWSATSAIIVAKEKEAGDKNCSDLCLIKKRTYPPPGRYSEFVYELPYFVSPGWKQISLQH